MPRHHSILFLQLSPFLERLRMDFSHSCAEPGIDLLDLIVIRLHDGQEPEIRITTCEESLCTRVPIVIRLQFLIRQKKSWVDSGSGSLPSE